MEIRIRAPSRLHFGLLAIAPTQGRRFGGVGLMIDAPGIELIARPATNVIVTGAGALSLRQRAADLAKRLLTEDAGLAGRQPGVAIEIVRAAGEHEGLGTGTQLALAVAAAVAALARKDVTAVELARWTDRGRRSAIGVHGFAAGGFLVDAGKGTETTLAPLVARADFPEEWPVLLIQPKLPPGLHGRLEQRVFDNPPSSAGNSSDELCRLLLMGMLPALAERDYPSFGQALFEYNHRVGELFAYAQGGPYADPLSAALIERARALGALAAGQSSWGPTVFAVVQDADKADWLIDQISAAFSLETAILRTKANNDGASTIG